MMQGLKKLFKTFFALRKLFFAGKVFICTRYAMADSQKKLFLISDSAKTFFFRCHYLHFICHSNKIKSQIIEKTGM